MRLMHIASGWLALSCLTLSPAFAVSPAQRGAHGAPPAPPARPATTTTATAPTRPSAAPTKMEAPPAAGPVEQRISSNPALGARLQPLLPPGTTLASAAAGFKNQGQFIAALHVSQNLNIPFAQLKAEMTGPKQVNLGQAIHDLRSNANAKAAVRTAEQQAKADLTASSRPPKTNAGRRSR